MVPAHTLTTLRRLRHPRFQFCFVLFRFIIVVLAHRLCLLWVCSVVLGSPAGHTYRNADYCFF